MTTIDLYDKTVHDAQIIDMYGKGHNATVIAKSLGLQRKQVVSTIDDWRTSVISSDEAKEQAKESLAKMQHSYDLILTRLWETVEQADMTADIKTKTTTLKAIADVQAKLVDVLQKAGLMDDAALGDELAETERKQAILVGIIKEVSSDCPKCKIEIASRLANLTGHPQPIIVVDGKI